MQITVKFKRLPTKEQSILIEKTMNEYVEATNAIVKSLVEGTETNFTSRNVKAELPSALKNQTIRDAKSVVRRYLKAVKVNCRKDPAMQKEVNVPVLKKPVATWNNQNFSVKIGHLSFPVWKNGKSTRLQVKAAITNEQSVLLENRLGSLRVSFKSGKLIAQIAVTVAEKPPASGQAVGVDLGLKIPAVAKTEDGKVRFFGNGRQNKFVKRRFRSKRKALGKAKKLSVIRKQHDKEQRWMRDQDHKISRNIVNFAKENHASVIRLEK